MADACAIPQVNETTFEAAVLASPLPVFVQFVEGDCVQCAVARRSLGDMLRVCAGRAQCYCIHGRSSPQLIARYRVAQFPTILLFRNTRVSRRLVGHPLPGQLEMIIRSEIAPPAAET